MAHIIFLITVCLIATAIAAFFSLVGFGSGVLALGIVAALFAVFFFVSAVATPFLVDAD